MNTRTLCLLAFAASSLVSAPALAICTTDLTNPENDCDLDGYTLLQGDCNDDKTICPAGACDPVGGPYVHGCECGKPAGALVNPGMSELCDGRDNNCDQTHQVDEGLHVDADGDGVRACGSCGAPASPSCDCNDGRSDIKPGATEICDGFDNDCNGALDMVGGARLSQACYSGPAGTSGIGVCHGGTQQCAAAPGSGTAAWGSCTGEVVPGTETCNGLDDDCDRSADEGLFVDADGDGVRACGTCGAPAAPNCDCNDSNAQIKPGATERCDGLDNDCNGAVDAVGGVKISQTCYSGPLGTSGVGICRSGNQQCAATPGSGTEAWGSCTGEQLPGTETCNSLDDDCDNSVDDGLIVDADGDGTRACGTCGAPVACDCDDTRLDVEPGAPEICDARDNDCDSMVDERDSSGEKLSRSCYTGPAPTNNVGLCHGGTQLCAATVPGTAAWGSCGGEVVPANTPSAPESLCDNRDEDCDGTADDGLAVDVDADGVRACGSCAAPVACDCDDTHATVKPGASESCDGLDNDCDGARDEQSSGATITQACYSGPAGTQNVGLCHAGSQLCTAAAGSGTAAWGACTGQVVPANTPSASELVCDGRDEDCDGTADDGLVTDADRDGVRACGTCNAPAAPACDCNDSNGAVRPGATETCDGVDNDCDETVDEGFDADGDTYLSCQGCGFSPCDCNDGNADVYPGAPEMCDCVDQDCDGSAFNGFADADGDRVPTCAAAECNDGQSMQHGAWCNVAAVVEACDGRDNDCDGLTDERNAAGDKLQRNCYTGPAGTVGIGTCVRGVEVCNASTPGVQSWTACNGQVVPANPPAQPETTCDGRDDDCDNTIDDGLVVDADGDGVRACGTCGAPAAPACDCNDSNPQVKPGAAELCDAVDQDCDGAVNDVPAAKCFEGANVTAETYTGTCPGPSCQPRGECRAGTSTCQADGTWTPCAGARLPESAPAGAELSCDGKDGDCDGAVDDGLLVDVDGDGVRACGSCNAPASCDCDDAQTNVKPGLSEICDGLDNDCNGRVDDQGAGLLARSCYSGPTGTEGVGTCHGGQQRCAASSPGVAGWGACEGEVVPAGAGADPEAACDGRDEDCDGTADDGLLVDADADGVRACGSCEAPAAPACDCADGDAEVKPGALEACDGIDNDCNGVIDGNSTECYQGPAETLGVGPCRAGSSACEAGHPVGECVGQVLPAAETCNLVDDDCDGMVDEDFDLDFDGALSCTGCPSVPAARCDCDDSNRYIGPDAPEICDCHDNDCDQTTDEGEVCHGAPCHDFDGDGYTNCQGDCDDDDPAINPSKTERVGNGKDDDCDGAADEDVDEDGDGHATGQGDCDDHNAVVHPGSIEVCDGFDNDCNGRTDEGFDLDGDYATTCAGDCDDDDATRGPFRPEICGNGADDDCDGRIDEDDDGDFDGVSTCEGDCNDFNAAVHPQAGDTTAAEEICDGQDNDCDRRTDEGFDEDGDGVATCFGDCDDADPQVNVRHVEVPGNGKDDDCDGRVDEGGDDADGDGFSPNCGDCDDANPLVNPHANEACDRIDNNCDSFTDSAPGRFDLCATCFDADGDGVTNCEGDCNDANAAVGPDAPEICDGLDNDCDGAVDLDGQGLKVCVDDAGMPDAAAGEPDAGGPAEDGGAVVDPPDAGEGGGQGDPAAIEVGCGCGSGGGGGALLLLGLAALAVTVRRPRRGTARLAALLVVGLGAAGCGSSLQTPVPAPDAGLSEGADAGEGIDAGTADAGPRGCGTLYPVQQEWFRVPGTRIPFAAPPRLERREVGGGMAVTLDDPQGDLAGFVLRRDVPSDLDPADPWSATIVAQRELAAIDSLGGLPIFKERVERLSRRIASGSTSSQSLEFGAPTEAASVRNRLLASLANVDPAALGALPAAPATARADALHVFNLLVKVTATDLVMVGAVSPAAAFEQHAAALADLTNGSHLGPANSVLGLGCELRTMPVLESDFIFVVDNSGSMQEEQQALSNAAVSLYAALQASGIDFRLGVISTDGEVLRGSGFTRALDEFQEAVKVGINGNGLEMGLEYAARAIQTARDHGDPARRLREGAGLVLVFFSDEDSANLRPVSEYARYFEEQGAVAYAIVGPQPNGCQRVGLGRANPGHSYIEVSDATGGSSGSICNPNLSETIREVLLGALGNASRSPLAKQPISGSLAVRTAEGEVPRSREQGFDYDPSGNTVLFFGNVPGSGTQFETAYLVFQSLL